MCKFDKDVFEKLNIIEKLLIIEGRVDELVIEIDGLEVYSY